MSKFYVGCDFGADCGRIVLAGLENDVLSMSEVRHFENQPLHDKDSLQWNIPLLYAETVDALTTIGTFQETVSSISCDSWAADYLLFEKDGTLISPTYHHSDPRADEGRKKILSKVPWETIYQETGVQQRLVNTLFQLGAEKSRRLNRAEMLLPVADGFNFLLTGVPRIEASLASTMQLYNPVTREWSERLVNALRLPPGFLPPVVTAGTKLGGLRPEIAKAAGLEDVEVVTSCSHEVAAALASLPVRAGESWAFLYCGPSALIGTELPVPVINDTSRDLNFTNEIGFGESIRFSKPAPGLWLLEECRRTWSEAGHETGDEILAHFAAAAKPFESVINPADPQFLTPGGLPEKIQAFCKETKQTVPRKPGAMTRCVLESLALHYRKNLKEIESLSGTKISRAYLLGDTSNTLLNHFIANALRIPVVITPPNSAAIGNVIVQAIAMGHISSIEQAREIVRKSFKTQAVIPHPTAWDVADERLAQVSGQVAS